MALNPTTSGVAGSGYYVSLPTSGTLEVFCSSDGFTRIAVLTFRDTAYCSLSAGATSANTVSSGAACTKLSDSDINAMATEKVYYNEVSGYGSQTFTKYSGTISTNANPGQVIQGSSYSAVKDATPSYTIGYGGWRFTHQNDWYQPDVCEGAGPGTIRTSFEYLPSSGNLYGCVGSCSSNCAAHVTSGYVYSYVK